MPKKWFPHAKWPKFLVGLHYYTMISFVLLVLTGIALYLPAVHTPLIPYLRFIYNLHILLGLIFTVTLLAPLLRKFLPDGKSISRPDWLMPTVFGTAIVVTGLMLWGVKEFPTTWRAPAFSWHGWLTAILGGWLILHAFLKAFGVRAPRDAWIGRIDPERRTFLRWLGVGVAGAAIVTIVDPGQLFRMFHSSDGRSGTGNATAASDSIPDFAAYYHVTEPPYPLMKLSDYTLQVNGKVAHPMTLKWADIQKLIRKSETVDFHCVTGWSVPHVTWSGFTIADLVALVAPHPSVKFVNFYSFDGAYTETLKLSEALDPSVLLATHISHQPLPIIQGFPVRLVVPKMYGYKSIKWVNRVAFSDAPIPGFWEERGYPVEAYWQ